MFVPVEREVEVVPVERVVVPVEREVLVPVLRLVEEDPEVRVFWSTVPAERVVVLPVERLTVPVEREVEVVPEEREVLVPVLRLVEEDPEVRVFWSTVPAERVVELPVERLTVPVERDVLPVLRVVRSVCAKEERLGAATEERVDVEP